MTSTADVTAPGEWTEYTCTGCGATFSALPFAISPHRCARPARASRDGDPCPPWCVTDHGKYRFHGAELITVEAPQFRSCYVRAIQYSPAGAPLVQVSVPGLFSVPRGEAADLAALIEQLATATPDQHRELAAAIRQAAAVITEASGA